VRNLDQVQIRYDAAHKEVGEIALHGENRWRMSIPAEPSRDSDLIIAGSLQDVPALVAELRAARELRAAIDKHHDDSSEPICACIREAAADYDKVTGEGS